ncbi:hypothetical protein [Pedobacter sp. N23S346]|uniref:hypothetical protein n=1 Tax=Pedobacter sp. N23S346 TaxID=3402750 RepID=UPI003AD73200
MNFDELKNEWEADGASETNISADMLKIREAHSPIDIIRRKMKHEFTYQIISLVLMAAIPYFFGFSANIEMVYLVFYAITCGFIAYYFFKFYQFYKNSYDMSMDSRKSILWFFYEMKLNIELYKALTYIIVFVWVGFLAVYLLFEKMGAINKILTKLSPAYILLNCFITILIIGVITELWAWYYYGKYLKRVKKIVDELDFEN